MAAKPTTMSHEARVELVLAFTTEALDSEWPEEYIRLVLNAILRLPNGEAFDGSYPEGEDATADLSDAQVCALVADYHWG
jgi:hypothetical protein